MKIIYYLHVLVTLFVLSTPFLPLKILETGIYLVPLIITISSLIFGGCILTHLEQRPSNNFIKDLLSNFFPNITVTFTDNLYTLVIVLIPTIIIFRIFHNH